MLIESPIHVRHHVRLCYIDMKYVTKISRFIFRNYLIRNQYSLSSVMSSANVSTTMGCEVSANYLALIAFLTFLLNSYNNYFFFTLFLSYPSRAAILVLYLSRQLHYDDDTATVIFHIFTMLVYFLCVFGAIISDSWLGKFKTILYLSLVYVVGSVLVSLGAVPPLSLPATTFTMIGLGLIALGSGGIKPCVSAFGGDQFKMPEQVKQMTTFFSLFYFSINAGSLISTTVTPILREDVHCFDEKECYSLAFGVPAVLMAISIGEYLFYNYQYSY